MEAVGLAFSVAQTLFAALKCTELRDIWSILGYDFDLESLVNTVSVIKSVLLDAEEKEALTNQDQNYIQRLKFAVYKADDLVDEFNALAERQRQQPQQSGILLIKLRLFLSCFGELGVARIMSKNFKNIREELDGVTKDAGQFASRFSSGNSGRRRMEETSCHVNERDVIGRERETEEVINMLVAPHDDNGVVAIVGAVGFGKTTLAQVVCSHDRVKNEFELRFWVCATHHDPNHGFVQTVLARVLELATGRRPDGSGFELVQIQLRTLLLEKRFLLVLDDLWIEDRNQWLKLKEFLEGCGGGSRVLVTTCSKKTALIVGCASPYEIKGLSEESSRMLLKRTAFHGKSECPELENIGKNIVSNCANVPLSVKLVGNFLYGQEKEKWMKYKQRGLSMLKSQGNPVMEVQKLDYLRLPSSSKCCFSYCAVFPKNFVIEKETLISLWMAQGFSGGNQTNEDHYEECFSILLQRCFFQDVNLDVFGEIVSCKMQNLVHALAVEVAGNEIRNQNSSRSSFNGETRHVSYHIGNENYTISDCPVNTIRTYLRADSTPRSNNSTKFPVNGLMEKWMCLRVLDLHSLNLQQLPKVIGTLIHLRYLDVSSNPELSELPKSITRLHYLQTLKIKGCSGLKELPKDFSKLNKLWLFDALDSGLKSMPSGMPKLASLRRLSMFVVSKQASDLHDLSALTGLKGKLQVRIKAKHKYVGGSTKNGYLHSMEHLNEIEIRYDGRVDGEEALLEDLQPHNNIKGLTLLGYGGARTPLWASQEKLPNLVKFSIVRCVGLQELTALGRLKCLKFVEIVNLESLEYVDGRITGEPSSSSVEEEEPFFPFVERLHLINLPNLREWRRGSTSVVVPLPNLSELKIEKCPNLTCTFVCPKVEKPSLYECNKTLSIKMEENDESGATTSASSSHTIVLPCSLFSW